MPTRFWRMPENRLKRCSEFKPDVCDLTATDQCCEAIPCTLCLQLGDATGSASFANNGWYGSVGNVLFFAYWERNEYTEECEFVVTLNGLEYYRASCYEGADCRDPSGETTFGADSLTWRVKRGFPLPAVDGTNGCKEWFCGDCPCTCECLCVTLTEVGGTVYTGRVCAAQSEGSCSPPSWEILLGYRNLYFELDRGEDGGCIIGLETGVDANYEPVFSYVAISDCQDISGTWTLEDGAIITIECGECGCVEQEPGPCICNRYLGDTVTMRFASANAPAVYHDVVLSYSAAISDEGIYCPPTAAPYTGYTGTFSGTLSIPMGGTRDDTIEFRVVCCLDCSGFCLYYKFGSQFSADWCRTTVTSQDCECPAVIVWGDLNDPACDVWSYQISDIIMLEAAERCV